jgi:Flp pilus assembly pilin Flp
MAAMTSRFRHLVHRWMAEERGESGGEFGLVAGLLSMIAIPAVAVVLLSMNGTMDQIFSFLA